MTLIFAELGQPVVSQSRALIRMTNMYQYALCVTRQVRHAQTCTDVFQKYLS